MKVFIGTFRRNNDYSLNFWLPNLRETYDLRAIAEQNNIIAFSNNAMIQVATRLEPREFVFDIPKTRIVNKVVINGIEQPQKKYLSEFIEENGGVLPNNIYVVWYQIPARLYLEVIRNLPNDFRLEVFTGGR